MEHAKRTGFYNICADYYRYVLYLRIRSPRSVHGLILEILVHDKIQPGYGDIVPKTMGGKLFTIFYAIISIPIFMWYIYRLGGAFRLVFMKAICILLLCVWYISLVK